MEPDLRFETALWCIRSGEPGDIPAEEALKYVSDYVKNLAVERDRYRAALKYIAASEPASAAGWHGAERGLIDVARKALADGGDDRG